MNKSFKGEYVSFTVRLIKRMAPLVLLVLLVIFKLYYGRLSKTDFVNYRVYFLVLTAICFCIGIYYHTHRIRTVVNEIRFTDTQLEIIGQDFTSKYEDSLNLDKVILEIQEEELGRNKTRFCLEIYCDDKFYYLNKFNDWDYKTLTEIVDEFKLRTGKSVEGMLLYSRLKGNNA